MLVFYNVDFIIMDGESFNYFKIGIWLTDSGAHSKNSLHAGVSTTRGQIRVHQATPQSAFIDTVNDYVENSETDDDGSMVEA